MQHRERAKGEEIEIVFTDEMLKEIPHFLPVDVKLQPVNKKLFATAIKPTDIRQSKTGNCYFLSALDSVLEQDPDYLSQIMTQTADGFVAIKLHDLRQPGIICVYKIDPTKVIYEKINDHTNDAIFLLEKAYAIHRHLTEREKSSDDDIIIDELRLQQLDVDKTVKALKAKSIKDNLHGDFTKAHIQKIKDAHKLDYHTALTGGYANDAYVSLLGVPAHQLVIQNEKNIYNFYLYDLIINILRANQFNEGTELTGITKEILIEIFGSLDNEDINNFFDRIINNPDILKHAGIYLDKIERNNVENKQTKREVVKEFFSTIDGLSESTKQKLLSYIDSHIALPKGMGGYTEEQEALYFLIKEKISQQQFVSIGTREVVGKEEEVGSDKKIIIRRDVVKGLLSEHSYAVVDAYERDGLKYLLLRNPWGNYVRGYEPKAKMFAKQEVNVLHAVAKKQLAPAEEKGSWWNLSVWQKKPDNEKEKYKKEGYFELELSDLKRFENVYYTEKQFEATPRHRK